jgi:hypothetical protein
MISRVWGPYLLPKNKNIRHRFLRLHKNAFHLTKIWERLSKKEIWQKSLNFPIKNLKRQEKLYMKKIKRSPTCSMKRTGWKQRLKRKTKRYSCLKVHPVHHLNNSRHKSNLIKCQKVPQNRHRISSEGSWIPFKNLFLEGLLTKNQIILLKRNNSRLSSSKTFSYPGWLRILQRKRRLRLQAKLKQY